MLVLARCLTFQLASLIRLSSLSRNLVSCWLVYTLSGFITFLLSANSPSCIMKNIEQISFSYKMCAPRHTVISFSPCISFFRAVRDHLLKRATVLIHLIILSCILSLMWLKYISKSSWDSVAKIELLVVWIVVDLTLESEIKAISPKLSPDLRIFHCLYWKQLSSSLIVR